MTARSTAQARAAHARWAARRRRLIGYGQWQPFMDAEPVRKQLRELMASGMPLSRVSAMTGVHISALGAVLYGSSGHPPSGKIRTESGRAVLQFRPELKDYPPLAAIDVTGSLRRLRALATLGWTASALAEVAGCQSSRFQRLTYTPTVSAATALLIREVYDKVWDRQPTDDEVAAPVAARTRKRAAAQDWSSPLAWDDESIDDPKAEPVKTCGRQPDADPVDEAAVIRALSGEKVVMTGRARTAAIERGIRQGMDAEAVAEVLGMDVGTVKRYWERAKQRARARGETWPDRHRWGTAA